MLYRALIRPILMRTDPEWAHEFTTGFMCRSWVQPLFTINRRLHRRDAENLATDLCGIPLSNPLGLAAGFDKHATLYPYLHQMGFSFAEIGTVTAQSQPGNDRPRLFRLVPDRALINRMGFNNAGADAVSQRLAAGKSNLVIGGNIGKSKITPLDRAFEDYEYSFSKLHPHVNYFVVNVSSPNTPNLRQLQDRKPLLDLLSHLTALNRERGHRPMLLKIAPDLNENQLADIVSVVEEVGIDGVIATNTTISREGLRGPNSTINEQGGLSGKPLTGASTRIIRFLRRNLPDRVQIVGVGGIFTGDDAFEKLAAGASCLQIYTGLIYRGPNTVFRILGELRQRMKREGIDSVRNAIGSGL